MVGGCPPFSLAGGCEIQDGDDGAYPQVSEEPRALRLCLDQMYWCLLIMLLLGFLSH